MGQPLYFWSLNIKSFNLGLAPRNLENPNYKVSISSLEKWVKVYYYYYFIFIF